MRGKKHPDELREKALAALAVNNNTAEIAIQLGLPETTVRTWKLKNLDDDDFVELRQKKKTEFVLKAWEIIEKATALLNRRVSTALKHETNIEELIQQIQLDQEMHSKTKESLINKLRALQVQNTRDLSTVIGTIYDKAALASGEATSRVEANLVFEQILREIQTIEIED